MHSFTEHKHLAFYGFACGSVCRGPTKVTATDTCGAAKLKRCLAFCSEGAVTPGLHQPCAGCRAEGQPGAGSSHRSGQHPCAWPVPEGWPSGRQHLRWQEEGKGNNGRCGLKRKQERPRVQLYQPETVSWSLLQPEKGELWAPLGHRLAPWVPLPEMLKARERRGPRPGGGCHP